jgi:hypothetical protein
MMMSMAGKKGSMLFFSKSRRDMAILPAPPASSMVRCVRPLRIETAGAGAYQAGSYQGE